VRQDPQGGHVAAGARGGAAAERRAPRRGGQAGAAADRLRRLPRAEADVGRRVPPRDALDDPVRGPRLAAVQAARVRAPARAGGGRRLRRQGPLPRAPARGDRGRRPTGGARVLLGRQEERRRAPAAALMGARVLKVALAVDWVMRLRRPAAVLGVLTLLLALPAGAARPIAHREVLPNGIVLLVAERPAVPIVGVPTFAAAGP